MDGDRHGDVCDNGPNTANIDQVDSDGDGLGDACEPTPRPCIFGMPAFPMGLAGLFITKFILRRRRHRPRRCDGNMPGAPDELLDDGCTMGELTACVVPQANEWRRQGRLSSKDVGRRKIRSGRGDN